MLAPLDGYLTGKSTEPAKKVALKFVKQNHAALGLTTGDLKTFKLKREYVDIQGVHHLYWIQRIGGQTVFGNGLTAAVTKDGRLLTLGGSPVSKANLPAPTEPEIDSARRAIADARTRLGATDDSRAGTTDSAEQVLFVTAPRQPPRLGHHGHVGRRPATQVVDARRGRLLYRNPLSDDAVGRAHRPGVPQLPRRQARRQLRGGQPHPQRLAPARRHEAEGQQRARLLRRQRRQQGEPERGGPPARVAQQAARRSRSRACPSARTSPARGTRTSRSRGRPTGSRTPPRSSTSSTGSTTTCWPSRSASPRPPATSRTSTPPRRARATTRSRPRPWTAPTTANGLPDGDHVDNANMNTPPDGTPPTMQMYLQHLPGTSYPDGDPFPANNTGDEAITVYHEYTHGLSNRLVVDVHGNSTLGPIQAGAMGEAWSDWYAADSLVSDGLEVDKKGKADLDLYRYDGLGGAVRPHPGHRLHAVLARVRLPRRCRPATPAATPTPTTARSSASPRSTPTARSGARRSGPCATRSAPASR